MKAQNSNSFQDQYGNKSKLLLANRFSHTVENGLFAKDELIKYGFSDEDFYLADFEFTEIGYLIGEPMIDINDDTCKSALELYKEKCISEDLDDYKMIEYFLREGL